jgi:hypothetical protein|tara:strand:- start:677 stop:1216 length:540 start_codon:yes stop_codon:yes gene_type:complete
MTVLLIALIGSVVNPSLNASLLPEATSACNRARKPVNVAILNALAEVESKIKLPAGARSVSWAAACMESGYRVRPRCGDKGKSCGMFQVRKWLTRAYKVDAYDYPKVLHALLTQVMRSMGKARRKCGKKLGRLRLFWIAYSWVTRGPQGWNCYGASKHKNLLRKWKRMRALRLKPKRKR